MLTRLLLSVVVYVLCFCTYKVTSHWSEMEIMSIESMNGTSGQPCDIELKIKRIKKGVYGLSGKQTMTDDVQAYTAGLFVYHSPARNNVYTLMPFKIPEDSACKILNTLYRQYIMEDLHAVSNFPYTKDPNDDLCLQFTKGSTNEVQNFVFDKEKLPKFAHPGMYKLHILVFKDNAVQSGLEVLADLS